MHKKHSSIFRVIFRILVILGGIKSTDASHHYPTWSGIIQDGFCTNVHTELFMKLFTSTKPHLSRACLCRQIICYLIIGLHKKLTLFLSKNVKDTF